MSYCLDEAVVVWGKFVESELQKVEGKNSKEIEQRSRVTMDRLLGKDEPSSGSYRDPADMFGRG